MNGARALRESDTPKWAGLQNPDMQLGNVDFRPWTGAGDQNSILSVSSV